MREVSHARGNTPSETGDVQSKRGWNVWPLAIIAFFAISIVGFAIFVVFCSLNPSELVRNDYYEQEIRYQAQMERVQRTAESAPGAAVTYDKTRQSIIITVPQSHVDAGASGTIHLYRPSAAGMDRHLPLELEANAAQTIDARTLSPGYWRVQVLWKSGGKDFFVEQKLTVGS